jgi:Glycosyl hydrolases family 38 N-terminal domain/Glycosyl hydrolases family 38 C-terminal domain
MKRFPLALVSLLALLMACAQPPPPAPTLVSSTFDTGTRQLIAQANRVVFLIPFSHWDTDWHDTFAAYSKLADGNILAAIQMAKQDSRFRYALEQTLFVQHFWENHPEARADLKALVQKRQLTFAWAGITQPETSLAAPAIQVRNLQLGQDWIAQTFGPEYVPHTAWQSDAFGNSAAFPILLKQVGIPYLFIGRFQARCDPNYQKCQPLPHAFYWQSPAGNGRVLVAYMTYSDAWGALYNLHDVNQEIAALRKIVDAQFQRTTSKYIFVPEGFDFANPLPDLPKLVDAWNAADKQTVVVMSDPGTAFQYLATQDLPTITVDMNPIWQAFYGSRPYAKIADKESEYYLTAGDKFGALLDAPQSSAWYTATMNAHYDNVGAVSFDNVWESTQRPRFEQTVATAANDLASTLARIASGINVPLVVFNPTSWSRSEVVELHGNLPDASQLPAPVQQLGPNDIALRADSILGIGFAAPTSADPAPTVSAKALQANGRVQLSNALVSVTLDPGHGGTFSALSANDGPSLLANPGDDITYMDDHGDIYGSFFGSERARESQTTAQVTILADGPLLARAQAVFSLGGQPITKTVTLRADDPMIEVQLQIAALPKTSAIVETPTTLAAQTRTDDLGFAAFQHPVDNRPIVAGDITYRREIFYPITYWGDVSDPNHGLALITHGLQGLGGTGTLNLLLVRDVTDTGRDNEGVTDLGYHTLRYAYLPHAGPAPNLPEAAYAFNQPLIPVWRAGGQLNVQLPFDDRVRQFDPDPAARAFPNSLTLISAQNGILADLFPRNGQMNALVVNYAPATAATLHIGEKQIALPAQSITLTPVELK